MITHSVPQGPAYLTLICRSETSCDFQVPLHNRIKDTPFDLFFVCHSFSFHSLFSSKCFCQIKKQDGYHTYTMIGTTQGKWPAFWDHQPQNQCYFFHSSKRLFFKLNEQPRFKFGKDMDVLRIYCRIPRTPGFLGGVHFFGTYHSNRLVVCLCGLFRNNPVVPLSDNIIHPQTYINESED
jgi:hypothetical protein